MAVANIELVGTKFPNRLVFDDPTPLKRGRDNEKIGNRVQKGALKGALVLTLTLEERATCSPTCGQWARCYGNHMRWAWRQAGERMVPNIEAQLGELFKREALILVRLHVLGDFYDTKYVQFWERMLRLFPGLWIWGYTHWRPDTQIGMAVQTLLNTHHRCRISLSCDTEKDLDVLTEGGYAIVVEDWANTPKGFVKCPAELTKNSLNCVDCGMCFPGSIYDVAFKVH